MSHTYGLNEGDRQALERLRQSEDRERIWFAWLWVYCSARGEGVAPNEAADTAFAEWDI